MVSSVQQRPRQRRLHSPRHPRRPIEFEFRARRAVHYTPERDAWWGWRRPAGIRLRPAIALWRPRIPRGNVHHVAPIPHSLSTEHLETTYVYELARSHRCSAACGQPEVAALGRLRQRSRADILIVSCTRNPVKQPGADTACPRRPASLGSLSVLTVRLLGTRRGPCDAARAPMASAKLGERPRHSIP